MILKNSIVTLNYIYILSNLYYIYELNKYLISFEQ